ncbi:MAG: hypothetical protein K2X27_24670, partial [Candidatus Obscuribacterales bacterium]|nr:hypothetical protein [Candidatus Obscuribacterales bacterium]
MKLQKHVSVFLSFGSLLFLLCLDAGSSLASGGREGFGSSGIVESNREAQTVAASAKLLFPPCFRAGQVCTMTVVDNQGKALPYAGIYVNEELKSADERGEFSFRAPELENLELALLGDGKRRINKLKFHRIAQDIFAQNDKQAELVAGLLFLRDESCKLPRIIYAPAVV